MKRIANILKDTCGLLGTALIIGLTLLMACNASAQAQTRYAIDQPLEGRIQTLQIDRGWQVRIVKDTLNMISILSPCEYYFAEGNEPQVCRLRPEGKHTNRLCIWRNRSMPIGTEIELHLRDTLGEVYLLQGATVTADTLLLRYSYEEDYYSMLHLYREASFQANYVRSVNIRVDSNATAHIGTASSANALSIRTQAGSTLTVDSLDSHKTRVRLHPTCTSNLTESDTARQLSVKRGTGWLGTGITQLTNTIGIDLNSSFTNTRYNSPYSSSTDITVVVGLHTNVARFNSWGGLSFGLEYGIDHQTLSNSVYVQDRRLVLDTINPLVNRSSTLQYMYIGLPLRLHVLPPEWKDFVNDIHLGLTPMFNFHQRHINSRLQSDNWTNNSLEKVDVFNTFQLRADIGFRIEGFRNIEYNFYFDLLPTYRRETGIAPYHNIGFQLRF